MEEARLGEGSEFRYPLGLVILGGVMTSALLTLFVVPAAFYQFERRTYERKQGGGPSRPTWSRRGARRSRRPEPRSRSRSS